jgi:predicted dehydrogenase
MTIRWAVVATGGMARAMVEDFHLISDAEIKVIVSRTQARADEAAREWNIAEGSSDYDSVLKRSDIDAVYIATPHVFHFEQSKRALEAGKHVLVEKPITMNANEARELQTIAKRSGKFLMEAMWMVFSPAIVEALLLAKSGALGTVTFVEANFGVAFDFDRSKAATSRLWNRKLGGGTLLDQGIYPISLAHELFGKPIESHVRGDIGETDIDIEAAMVLEFAGGERAALSSSMRNHTPLNASISGDKGFIEIESPFWAPPAIRKLTRDPKTQRILTDEREGFIKEGNGYVPMLREVHRAIKSGATEHPMRTLDQSISVMENIDGLLADIRRTNGKP